MDAGVARSRLAGFISSYFFTQAIASAVSMGIPDLVSGGLADAATIAKNTGCSASDIERLMRALCTIGVFKESSRGYEHTSMSVLLRSDAPDSLAPWALFHGSEMYRACAELGNSMRKGVPAWQLAHGMTIWEYLEARPERGAIFDAMMRVPHATDTADLLDACQLADTTGLIVDVGGGDGSFMAEVARRFPTVRTLVLDRPDVVARAAATTERRAIGCQFIPGDFLREVPRGADVYVLRHVLHDWSDEDSLRILRNCREAMAGDARLLVIEGLLGTAEARGWSDWSDLGVMLMGGKERNLATYRALFAQAGLVLADVRRAGPRVHVLEATLKGSSGKP